MKLTKSHYRNILTVIGIALLIVIAIALWPNQIREKTKSVTASKSNSNAISDQGAPSKSGKSINNGLSSTADRSISSSESISVDTQTLLSCRYYLMQKRYMETINCDVVTPTDVDGQVLCSRQVAAVRADIDRIAVQASKCPSSISDASVYFSSLRDNAITGDVVAQRCFLRGYFEDRGDASRLEPRQIDQYKTLAKQFIETSFKRGDWKVVKWLARFQFGPQDALLSSAYNFGPNHPETTFVMNELLVLGRTKSASEAKGTLNDLQNNGSIATTEVEHLTEVAKEMYEQQFAGIAESTETLDSCK